MKDSYEKIEQVIEHLEIAMQSRRETAARKGQKNLTMFEEWVGQLLAALRASGQKAKPGNDFAAADAELHAVLPPNVSHEVLETMPPLPKEWSASIVCGKVLAYGESKVSPQMALAIGIINFLIKYHGAPPPPTGEG